MLHFADRGAINGLNPVGCHCCKLRAEVGALREALAALITWIPSADAYRHLGIEPETPMQVLKEAEAVLFKENKQ